jgi:hypothetical protein
METINSLFLDMLSLLKKRNNEIQNIWKGLWDRASGKLGFLMDQSGTKVRNASQFLVSLPYGRNKIFPTG